MKSLLFGLILFASSLSLAAEDPRTTTGKVAELATHRVDRLVLTKVIDANFLHRMEHIEVVKLTADSAAYRAVVTQTAPTQGSALQLEITFDANGKYIAHKVLEGGTVGVDPLWSKANAGKIMENAMHFVLENTAKPDVEPYFLSMTRATLTKGTYKDQPVAVVKFLTSSQAQTLNVYVNLDGKFISYEIVP